MAPHNSPPPSSCASPDTNCQFSPHSSTWAKQRVALDVWVIAPANEHRSEVKQCRGVSRAGGTHCVSVQYSGFESLRIISGSINTCSLILNKEDALRQSAAQHHGELHEQELVERQAPACGLRLMQAAGLVHLLDGLRIDRSADLWRIDRSADS